MSIPLIPFASAVVMSYQGFTLGTYALILFAFIAVLYVVCGDKETGTGDSSDTRRWRLPSPELRRRGFTFFVLVLTAMILWVLL